MEQIEIAATWWSHAIQDPKFDALGEQRDRNLAFGQVMAKALAPKISLPLATGFRDALVRRLLAGEADDGDYEARLDSDYGPDRTLWNAARDAGITDEGCFPWKTTMWLYTQRELQYLEARKRGRVFLRYGYSSPVIEVTPDLLKASR